MKAYKCDLCGKYVDDVAEIGGFYHSRVGSGHSGRYYDENKIKEICPDCYNKIEKSILELEIKPEK